MRYIIPLALILSGCGGWHPLNQAAPVDPGVVSSGTGQSVPYTATVAGNGTVGVPGGSVTPSSGSVAQGSVIRFVVTIPAGYSLSGRTETGASHLAFSPALAGPRTFTQDVTIGSSDAATPSLTSVDVVYEMMPSGSG